MSPPDPTFSSLLAHANRAAAQLAAQQEDEGLLSLALPLPPLDPLAGLPWLAAASDDDFRFLWDCSPGLCIAASGYSHGLELSGPRRFELAQRFASASLSRLGAVPQDCPPLARPRLLLAFGFFDAPLESGASGVPGVQAVLPRWQLSRQGRQCWLRLQRPLAGGVTPRSLAEELWEMGARLQRQASGHPALAPEPGLFPDHRDSRTGAAGPAGSATRPSGPEDWQQAYRRAAERALELVEGGSLQKLVLAVRQQLPLERPLDPLTLLARLRRQQGGSCRFLWQRQADAVLVGASPERLLTVRQGQLRSDALAGTAPRGPAAEGLLHSVKDRLEHELVAETIMTVLAGQGLKPRRPRHPRLARHGQLLHLHSPISASLQGQHPLAIAAELHPTPAVAGLPRRQAMGWLRSLEPFERGHYAAPIGWIDGAGDTELRVAIRSGILRGQQLELTAGAGLVRGSVLERELQEVALKLGVLQQQLNLGGVLAA